MKILMTGATGVAGRLTVPALVAAGHDVRAVSRRPEADAGLRAVGAEPVEVDLFDAAAVERAAVGAEAVIHLATNVPPMSKAARPKGWETHNRLRVEATANLVRAARTVGAARFVKESITFVYADGGDQWLTEQSPLLAELGLLAGTVDGERQALAFSADGGEPVVLRFGLFYGGAANRGTSEALALARWRRTPIAGAPGAYMSSIHAADVATAVVAALAAPSGLYNVVDDEPLTRSDYLTAFGAAFGITPPKPTPPTLIRLVGGKSAGGLIASQRVSNAAFRASTGWAPRYPSAHVGWSQVATEWKDG